MYVHLEDLEDAEEIYKQGLALNPHHIGILTDLVDLYLEKSEEDIAERTTFYWKAREVYEKAEGILKDQITKSEDANTLFQLGDLLLKMKEYEEAEKILLKALEKDKTSAETYAKLGEISTFKEDYKKAIQYFESAIKRDPYDLMIKSALAEAYHNGKLGGEGRNEYKKILNITPYHQESLIGLGEVYTVMGERENGDVDIIDMYDQSISYFTEAINLANSEKASKDLRKRSWLLSTILEVMPGSSFMKLLKQIKRKAYCMRL